MRREARFPNATARGEPAGEYAIVRHKHDYKDPGQFDRAFLIKVRVSESHNTKILGSFLLTCLLSENVCEENWACSMISSTLRRTGR